MKQLCRGSYAVLAASAVVVLSLAACAKPSVKVVKVPAKVAWTDTGVDLKIGQSVTIAAKGEIAADKNTKTDAGGFVSKPEWRKYNVVEGAPHMALIGRIGVKGTPVGVGTSWSGKSPADGRLFLGINDKDPKNNIGELQVTITVK